MALSNAQYDKIMREYQKRQIHNEHLTKTRLEEVYRRLPELKSIQEDIASTAVKAARQKLEKNISGYERSMQTITKLREKKANLLFKNGLPKEYF